MLVASAPGSVSVCVIPLGGQINTMTEGDVSARLLSFKKDFQQCACLLWFDVSCHAEPTLLLCI